MDDIAYWLTEQFISDEDEIRKNARSSEKVCRLCGESGLHWRRMGLKGWRLFDEDGLFHACKEKGILVGDIADDLYERILEMSYECEEDAIVEFPQQRMQQRRVSCKYCGGRRLRWKKQGLQWRLFDEEGMLHSCRGHKEARDPQIYTKEEALRLKKDRWIDTSDGLPPCGMEVLVETCEGIITALTRYKKSDGAPVDMSWWDNKYPGCGENVHRVFAVSRWRKLPGKKPKISIEKVGR